VPGRGLHRPRRRLWEGHKVFESSESLPSFPPSRSHDLRQRLSTLSDAERRLPRLSPAPRLVPRYYGLCAFTGCSRQPR
jgi:hypothetical protein